MYIRIWYIFSFAGCYISKWLNKKKAFEISMEHVVVVFVRLKRLLTPDLGIAYGSGVQSL